jgi:hypothetical protein
MSDIDLTEAIEAAARGWFESAPFAPPWDGMGPMVKHRAMETMLPGITAAAPLIEAQVREQIAEENLRLRAFLAIVGDYGIDLLTQPNQTAITIGGALVNAARIARGDRP